MRYGSTETVRKYGNVPGIGYGNVYGSIEPYFRTCPNVPAGRTTKSQFCDVSAGVGFAAVCAGGQP
jgi:hypothetical protein